MARLSQIRNSKRRYYEIPLITKICECGCGQSFQTRIKESRFIPYHFRKRIYNCNVCGKKMIKIKSQSGKTYAVYKPNCEHMKGLRLSVG